MAASTAEVTQALLFCAQAALGVLAPHWIIRFDTRRLDRIRWLRTWPPATHWVAVVVFGPLAVLVHFLRTRRSLFGAVIGVFAAGLAVLPGVALALIAG